MDSGTSKWRLALNSTFHCLNAVTVSSFYKEKKCKILAWASFKYSNIMLVLIYGYGIVHWGLALNWTFHFFKCSHFELLRLRNNAKYPHEQSHQQSNINFVCLILYSVTSKWRLALNLIFHCWDAFAVSCSIGNLAYKCKISAWAINSTFMLIWSWILAQFHGGLH